MKEWRYYRTYDARSKSYQMVNNGTIWSRMERISTKCGNFGSMPIAISVEMSFWYQFLTHKLKNGVENKTLLYLK